jgi:hypothetical protein
MNAWGCEINPRSPWNPKPAQYQPHLTMLGWMVSGLLLNETICFNR